jgi:hypothetical protein
MRVTFTKDNKKEIGTVIEFTFNPDYSFKSVWIKPNNSEEIIERDCSDVEGLDKDGELICK